MTLIPDNRKIDGRGQRQVKLDPPTGGGDVYLAGDNNFTGENDFENVPTSQEDATQPDELVRLSQIIKYKEGEWIPEIKATTTSPSVVYANREAWYVRAGNSLNIHIRTSGDSISGGVGSFYFDLPAGILGVGESYESGNTSVGSLSIGGFNFPAGYTSPIVVCSDALPRLVFRFTGSGLNESGDITQSDYSGGSYLLALNITIRIVT